VRSGQGAACREPGGGARSRAQTHRVERGFGLRRRCGMERRGQAEARAHTAWSEGHRASRLSTSAFRSAVAKASIAASSRAASLCVARRLVRRVAFGGRCTFRGVFVFLWFVWHEYLHPLVPGKGAGSLRFGAKEEAKLGRRCRRGFPARPVRVCDDAGTTPA